MCVCVFVRLYIYIFDTHTGRLLHRVWRRHFHARGGSGRRCDGLGREHVLRFALRPMPRELCPTQARTSDRPLRRPQLPRYHLHSGRAGLSRIGGDQPCASPPVRVNYLCMYVCMVCMHACMHVCMLRYACMHACMHACMYACMHVCV